MFPDWFKAVTTVVRRARSFVNTEAVGVGRRQKEFRNCKWHIHNFSR